MNAKKTADTPSTPNHGTKPAAATDKPGHAKSAPKAVAQAAAKSARTADKQAPKPVAAADAKNDPTSLYMQGKLKATGSSGELFTLLRSGEVSRVIARLASRP